MILNDMLAFIDLIVHTLSGEIEFNGVLNRTIAFYHGSRLFVLPDVYTLLSMIKVTYFPLRGDYAGA
jgi:hypothetical protein